MQSQVEHFLSFDVKRDAYRHAFESCEEPIVLKTSLVIFLKMFLSEKTLLKKISTFLKKILIKKVFFFKTLLVSKILCLVILLSEKYF